MHMCFFLAGAPVGCTDDLVARHGGVGNLAHHIAVGEPHNQPAHEAGKEREGEARACSEPQVAGACLPACLHCLHCRRRRQGAAACDGCVAAGAAAARQRSPSLHAVLRRATARQAARAGLPRCNSQRCCSSVRPPAHACVGPTSARHARLPQLPPFAARSLAEAALPHVRCTAALSSAAATAVPARLLPAAKANAGCALGRHTALPRPPLPAARSDCAAPRHANPRVHNQNMRQPASPPPTHTQPAPPQKQKRPRQCRR